MKLLKMLLVSLLLSGCGAAAGPGAGAPPASGVPAPAPTPSGFDFEVTVANWSTRDAAALVETPAGAWMRAIPAGGAVRVDVAPAPAWVRVSAPGFSPIEVVAGRDYASTDAGVGVALR